MRVVIAGGSGFLGTALAASWRADGASVRVLTRRAGRPGDVASCYADPALAESLMGWKARRGLKDMCVDSWRWQSTNPQGFEG